MDEQRKIQSKIKHKQDLTQDLGEGGEGVINIKLGKSANQLNQV